MRTRQLLGPSFFQNWIHGHRLGDARPTSVDFLRGPSWVLSPADLRKSPQLMRSGLSPSSVP